MKHCKRYFSILAMVMLVCTCSVKATDNISFTDVSKDEWYYEDVCLAYNMALINGRSETIFAPNEFLTCAEAVKLAACMYQVYTNDAPFVASYDPWYQIYVDYCYEKGIISREYKWEQNITRGEYIDIFARALPAEALNSINPVADEMVSDVPMSYTYAASIYKMYRAGIVRGQDDNLTCSPESYVKRSEVAAILTRMMDPSKRIKLDIQVTEETSDSGVTPVTPSTPSDGNNQIYPTYPTYPTYPYYPSGSGTGTGNGNGTETSPGNQTPEEPKVTYPWEISGAKQPMEYTWEEYNSLTQEQKIAFRNTFSTTEAFDNWLNAFNQETEKNPWENGGKLPSAYTWAEFETLSSAQQAAFYNWFDSDDAWEMWVNSVQGNEDQESGKNPWENGGKMPSAYTWAEFEALTSSQKDAFYKWFESEEALERWMNSVQGNEDQNSGKNPWENGGKLPPDYTLAEFEALSETEQESFIDWFASRHDFDLWWNSVN